MKNVKTPKEEKLIKCRVTTSQEEKPRCGYWEELVGEFMLPEAFVNLLLDHTNKKRLDLHYDVKEEGPFYCFELTKNEHDRKIEVLVLQVVNLFRYWNVTVKQASEINELKNKIIEIKRLVDEFDDHNPSPPNGWFKKSKKK